VNIEPDIIYTWVETCHHCICKN